MQGFYSFCSSNQTGISEAHIRAQLDHAGSASAGYLSKLRIDLGPAGVELRRRIHGGELRVVERVITFYANAELPPLVLAEPEILLHREVPVVETRPTKTIHSRVAECTLRGDGESSGIEPLIERMRPGIGVSDYVDARRNI